MFEYEECMIACLHRYDMLLQSVLEKYSNIFGAL